MIVTLKEFAPVISLYGSSYTGRVVERSITGEGPLTNHNLTSTVKHWCAATLVPNRILAPM